jgi:hypothetical protein
MGLLSILCGCAATFAGERPHVFGINRVGGEGALYSPAGYGEDMYTRLREIGGTAVRLAASPREIERTRGKRNWGSLEHDIDLAVKYGMEPMVCIVNTPVWALPIEQIPDHEEIMALPEAERFDRLMGQTHMYPYRTELLPEFTDFCRELAERTKGKVRIFQLWNEPNGCSWHFHDGWNHYDEYVPLLAAAREGIKAGNPNAELFLGGLDDAQGHAHIFLEGTYEEMAKQFPDAGTLFDGITDHPYSHDVDTMGEKLLRLKGILEEHGDGGMPIWITEYGWHTGGMSLEDQAKKVREFLAAFNEWDFLDGAIYLSLADFEGGPKGFGVCDSNLRPRPAFYAFQGAPRFGASPPCEIEWKPIAPDTVEISWKTVLRTAGKVEVEGSASPFPSPTTGAEHVLNVGGLSPGESITFTITTETTEEGKPRKEFVSAPYTFRMPDRRIFNGDFEGGFFGGIAEGWTMTGESFCTDAAVVPGAGALEGGHAQAIYTSGKDNQDLHGLMFTRILAAGGSRCVMSAHWRSDLKNSKVPVMARLGIDPAGGEDPKAMSVAWTDWGVVPKDWTAAGVETKIPAKEDEEAGDRLVTCFIECRTPGDTGANKPVFVVDDVRITNGE